LRSNVRELLHEDGLVIDVGENVGRHVIPLAKKVGNGGCVMALESIPQRRELLHQSINANGIQNIVTIPFALSKSRGVSEFNYIPSLTEESGLKSGTYTTLNQVNLEKYLWKYLCFDEVVFG
jgi:FkbM family methyltransferase